MKIIDISMSIEPGMAVYKNRWEKEPIFKTLQDHSNSSSRESGIDMSLHTGTHMDAPLHMIKDAETADKTDLQSLITHCKVLDFSCADDCITKSDLESKNIKENDFVLLKTKNSFRKNADSDFVFLEKSGAQYLSGIGIKGVGIDALGIERDQPGHETHISLLSKKIVIIEGLRLAHAQEGEYFLVALPIKIKGTEAAPLRAVLLDKDTVF